MAAVRAKVPVLLHDRYSAQIHKGLALMDKLLERDVTKACLPVRVDFTELTAVRIGKDQS